jgi:UDP-glucose 4-epimerase
MKKILITGSGSYIGESFKEYLKNFGEEYSADTLDMQSADWREHDFSGYDVVYHVAGIAHRKETSENAHLYYEVNRDLALEVARKAKSEGVSQLIFLSSMSVYGVEKGVITPDTPLAPKTNYGRSKMEAEEGMAELASEDFAICTLRPPMVYGKGCKGNFVSVVSLVRKLPFFPRVENRRSMIYIDNLSSFVKMAIDRELSGVYFPQNREYMNTSQMAMGIAEGLGKKCRLSRLLGFGVKLLMPFVSMAKKGFGTLIYENTESLDFEYIVISAEDSVKKSV